MNGKTKGTSGMGRGTNLFTEFKQDIILSGQGPASGRGAVPLRSAVDFGCIVRRQRRVRGLTQTALAASASVGPRFICDLEAGKPTIQIAPLLRVFAALGILAAGFCSDTALATGER